ncbi:signal transduction histidine kinase [Novosphingobium kunmingense]|uniref:histidine kinase n=1 Tax=Novosphingobium kunmingense TaxID=1211806 RepID=A0A2N0H3J2_9SPHN|nr:signal transduction histidine kinase [Novosphingobium kunmingense]
MHESETRYHTLFDTMDEGFCVIRFLDGADGPLSDYVHVEANPAYERHAGIPNVVGQKVREMVPDEAASWVATYREVLLTGVPIRFQQELVATGRHLELSAFRIEPPSRREVAVLFQDVTERAIAENQLRVLNATLERRVDEAVAQRESATVQLREAQKLETLGQLTGGLAHDMNNLLAPIISALDLLQRRHGKEDRSGRALDRALQSAERAKTLVSRMLGFARKQALVTTAVDVHDLLHGMADLIASSVGSTVGVSIEVSDGLPAILVDANQLELAILNLCINAKDAMTGGGQLKIVATKFAGSATRLPSNDQGFVSIAIIDTGIGMDAETLAKAIEPFFSTKEVGKGTGLGLSMVHGFAAQTGGAFNLTSSAGQGTTAELILPATSKQIENAGNEMESHLNAQSSLFLLVDDEPLVRMGTADMLEELGHEVLEANSGAEALTLLASRTGIKAVITDYTMPGMTGAELIQRIRESGSQVPILLVTGYAARDIDLDVPQLTKPFRLAELEQALEAL